MHTHTLFLNPATNLCFAEKAVFTQEVLAVVLQQLVEQTPTPMLFMRTVSYKYCTLNVPVLGIPCTVVLLSVFNLVVCLWRSLLYVCH